MSRNSPAGIGVAAAALVFFAANSLLCRYALGAEAIDPASFTLLRLASGAALLALVAGRPNRSPAPVSRSGSLSAGALFTYAACFSLAYADLSAATGALLLFAAVQASMIVAAVLSGERPGGRQWLGLSLAIAGVAYLMSPGLEAPPFGGALLMILAGAAWGIYSVLGRGATDPLRATAEHFRWAVVPAALLALPWLGSSHMAAEGVLAAAVSGAVASGLGYAVWLAALRRLTTTGAAAVQLATPILVALGGVSFLSESFSPRLLLSSAMVLGGIALAIHGHRSSSVARRWDLRSLRAPVLSKQITRGLDSHRCARRTNEENLV